MTKLFDRFLFELLRLLDQLFPGWSQPVDYTTEFDHGRPLSAESVHYWTTGERCRRVRD